ncbi:MAG: hypothetical protein ACRCTJ_07585 [Brevinema sp.]
MPQNMELRYYHHIINMLLEEGYDLFKAPIKGEGSDLIIRSISNNGTPRYIEIQLLSRREEFINPIEIPVKSDNKNNFVYFILFSSGMRKIWVLRDDELMELRKLGEDRDTDPYRVKNFARFKFPELLVAEFKKQAK